MCGLYLLGVFRTDHDHGDVKVGTGRIIFGAVFLGLAIYMAPALFGRPPQSLVWDRLIVGILPPDSSEFAAPRKSPAAEAKRGVASHEVKATSTDPGPGRERREESSRRRSGE